MDEQLEETDLVVELVSTWQDRTGPVRRQISFVRAKELIYPIFDDVGVPRPFVKCTPANNHMQGFVTAEHEIFISELPRNATVIEACAQLLLGLGDSTPVQQNINHNSVVLPELYGTGRPLRRQSGSRKRPARNLPDYRQRPFQMGGHQKG
ncbi:hypothetical protein [Phyllobacterium sp. K27]